MSKITKTQEETLNKNLPAFLEDLKSLQKKHKLDQFKINLSFKSPQDIFTGGCDPNDMVQFHDPVTHKVCWKCPNDTTPCP
jgi:hypothetical protein